MHLDRTLTFFQAADRRLIEIVFRGGNMEKPSLLNLHLSNKLTLPSCIPLLTNMLRLSGRLGAVIAVCALLTSPSITVAQENYVASEFIEEEIQNGMSSADIVALLDQTVCSATRTNPAIAHPLRQGLYVTATLQRSDIILKFELDRSDTKQRYTVAEIAISADLGSKFFEFTKAALASAESIFAAEQFAQPWEIDLAAESDSGGQVTLKAAGDATAHFTLSWEIASPRRPLDSFVVPTAFGSKKPGSEHINVVVHFPTSLEQFQFLSTIYVGGVAQRFQDLPLHPHTWLHLTVTNGSTDRYVNVHFDAITTEGQRLFIAEAPASTDVGGRFLNETLTRMQEMLSQEAAKPGSSGKWRTEFYYDTPDDGVVVVAVTGERGLFDVAYELQTPTQAVKKHGKRADN
jgi:hypothetical protein